MKTKEQLQAQLDELQRQINEVKEDKIDFSEFVWINNFGSIVIKWDKLLKSSHNWDIKYSNDYESSYNKTPDYIETTFDKLKVWDVFIYVVDVDIIHKRYFYNYRGKNTKGVHIVTFLNDDSWIEVMDYNEHTNEYKIYKFLRN